MNSSVETANPERDLPIGIIHAFVLVTLVAWLSVLAYRHPDAAWTAVIGAVLLAWNAVSSIRLRLRYPYRGAAQRFRDQELDRLRQAMRENTESLLQLSPTDFEDAMAGMFSKLGSQVTRTPASNDGGKDLVLRDGGKTVFVELKRFAQTNKVGRPLIMKLHSAIIHEAADEGVFVTTSTFTEPARDFAVTHGIRLVDGGELALMMRDAYPNPDDPNSLRCMCVTCGDVFSVGDGLERTVHCRQGHPNAHPIPESIRNPVEYRCPHCKGNMLRRSRAGERSHLWHCSVCGQTGRPVISRANK